MSTHALTPTPAPTVAAFRNAYSGRVAILLSGTTAAEQDLSRVGCPILGVNQSYRMLAPTFAHLVSGIVSAGKDAPILRALYPGMPVFSWKPGHGALVIPRTKFSVDAEHGIHWHSAPLSALQLVVYMGFTEVVYIGLDLKRRGAVLKAWEVKEGVPSNPYDPTRDYLEQRVVLRKGVALLAAARPDVSVLNVSFDTTCDAIRTKQFNEIFL